MTLDQIAEALRSDITDGAIDLVTAATGDLASMAAALDLLQLKTHFIVTNAVLTQPVNQVLLRGTAQYGLPGAQAAGTNMVDVGVSLVATLDAGGNAVFTLTLFLPPQSWRFSDTFASLPDCQQIGEDGSTVELAPSFLIGLPLLDAALAASSVEGASATLTGSLPQAGIFAQPAYSGLFPGRWPLAAKGTLVLPASYDAPPDLDMMATVGGSTLPFGDTTLFDLGFELAVQTGFDPDNYGYSAVSMLNLVGTVQFDPEHSLRLVLAIMTVQTTWRLLVEADPDTIRIGDQIEQVAKLLGLSVSELISPDTLDTFNAFYLSSIEIWLPAYQGSLLDNLGAAAFDVSHIGVTLKSDRVWNPPIPFVRVIDTGMRWDIGWLKGIDNKPVMYTSGSVFGGLNVGASNEEAAARPSGRSLPLLSAPQPVMGDVRVPVPEQALAADADDDGPILADSFTVDLAGYIPSFVIEGRLRTKDEIPIGYAFNQFFGNPGPPTEDQMRITSFAFRADPYLLTFQAEAVITMHWSIPFTNSVSLDLIELRFNIDVRQAAVGGSIAGVLQLTGGGSGEAQPQFTVSAEYVPSTRASEWTFRGILNQNAPLELVTLVANLLTDDPPSNLPALNVEQMAIEFKSESQAYKVSGSILARWQFAPFGTPLTISARAEAAISRPNAQTSPSGYLAGSFQINRIGLYASRDIGVEFPTYTFRVLFGDAYLTAQTAWIGDGEARHQIVTLQLSSITLGEVLEYLVNLAAPTLGYKLTSPWDLLNQIDLSRFTLTIDPTEQTIALTYDVTVDLTIFRVDRIGVKYSRKQGEGSVNLILEGAALGQDYTGDDALDWDVINDNPPDLVPANSAVIDLRYLAFGQHVKVNGIENLNTVRAVLLQMERAMQPVASDQSPIGQPGANGVSFDAESQWLIGLDIGIAGMIDLGLIFNDPRLYGLSISMGGPDAGSLAGLYFEILYKKITDSLGMFRVELQVPEAFRHLEFGEVSVTLGVIVVEVYTNGNFKVDLGFPHERDFSRSFSVEVFPFIGRGGIYFGLLDGNSSSRVPAIVNGFFAPVIELGIGLAVGVGKDFSVGVLSAGAFIELEVIFEGVFARFLPSNGGEDTAFYYWVRGVAGLHGKIYGTVDFVVIKVNVTLEASATVALTLEACQPTRVELDVEVKARATVKILFVKVHFSFEVSVSFDFTIGSKSTTPWILAGSGAGGGAQGAGLAAARGTALPPGSSASLYRSRGQRDTRMAVLRSTHLQQLHAAGLVAAPATPRSLMMTKAADRRGRTGLRMAGDAEAADTLNWDTSFKVFDDSPRTIPLILLPAFTCDNVALGWSAPPASSSPAYKIVMQLWAETGTVTDPGSIAESYRRDTATSAHAEDVTEMPAAELIEAFLRWAIYAVTNPAGGAAAADVTAGQLAHLADEMAAGGPATKTAFTFTSLSAFLDTNMRLSVSGQPEQLPAEMSAMPVALPPLFRFDWTGIVSGSVDLAVYKMIGPEYIADVAAYQQRFTPTAAQSAGGPDGAADTVSFASHMFSDWCLMIARSAVDEAQKQLATWELRPESATSLDALATAFSKVQVSYAVRDGDTVDSVALALGATTEELLYLNDHLDDRLRATPAGSEIAIMLGIAPEVIALDNANRDLVPGQYPVDRLTYQVRAGDTLAGIATSFGLAGPTSLLSDPALAANPALLRVDASFTAPATHYTAPAGFDALQSAAFFFARFQDTRTLPDRQWYVDLILSWNAEALRDQKAGDPIAPGLALKLPTALGNLTEPAEANYTTQTGDTANAIAAMADLMQNYGSGDATAVPGWATYRDAMVAAFTAGSGGAAAPALVPTLVTILPGESMDHLARRSYIFGGEGIPDVAGLIGWIAAAPDLLAVHTALLIDGFTLDTNVYPTFASVSEALALDIGELAHQLAGETLVPAIAEDDSAWVVTGVPVVAVDALVTLVLAGKSFTNISAQSSRQLMAGLRLPAPVYDGDNPPRATGPMTAMAALSGQQLDGPAPGTGTDPAITIAATLDSGYDWIGLVGSTVAGTDESRDALAARAPTALTANRQLARAADAEPAAGAILQLDPVGQLDFTYTPTELTGLYPAASLTIAPVSGPEALPLSVEVPVTYGLPNRVELQVTAPLAIPAEGVTPKTGNPSLWPFPATVQTLALAGAATPYDLVKSAPQGAAGGQPETLLSSSYGTLFSVRIKILPGSRTLYQLLGTDDVQRQTLLHLWQYLESHASPPPTLSLFVSPDPAAANIQGLAQVALDASLSTIVKTNLSTQTVPGLADVQPLLRAQAPAPRDPQPVYAAAMAQIPAFLKLLWEGVSVGGTGYYLTLSDSSGGGLPATIFTGGGEALIQFLAIVGAQQGSAPDGRALLPFNTCALIGPGLDASASTVYLEAADGSQMKRIATVPPGNAGMRMVIPMAPANPATPADRTLQLYSMAAYDVGQAGDTFYADRPGMPVTPEAKDDPDLTAVARQRLARQARARGEAHDEEEPTNWSYSQVFPIAQMGPASSAPTVSGLPPAAADPYRGINAGDTLPSADLAVGFVDIFGNATASDQARDISLPVGYTDVLVAFDTWPGLATGYGLAAGGVKGTVAIGVTFAAQSGTLMPGLSGPADSAVLAAENQGATYETIYYQLSQPSLTLSFASTLYTETTGTNVGQPKPVDLSAQLPALWRFAAANLLYARAVAALEAERPLAGGAQTVSALIQTYGLGADVLAAGQAVARAYEILGGQVLTIPAQVPFAENQSADSIQAAVRPGWPQPASGAEILTMPQNADQLPLRPGTLLAIPDRPITVPSGDPVPSLGAIAALEGSTAPLLAEDNHAATAILAGGVTIMFDGLTVTTDAPGGSGVRSFDDIVAAFAAQGVIVFVGDVGAELADQTGTLIAGAAMVAKRYLVPAPTVQEPFETLASNGSGTSIADLASDNAATPNVFDNGSLVYLGDFPGNPAAQPSDTTTLTEFCNQYGTTPALLFAALSQQDPEPSLPQGEALTVPGMLALPPNPAAVRIPCPVRASDTLAAIAGRFAYGDGGLDQLGLDNQGMPDLFVPGQTVTVTVDGDSYDTVTQAGDGIGSVLARLQGQSSDITLGDLMIAIGPQTGLLAGGALLSCPPAVMPDPANDGALSPNQASASFGIDAGAFLATNAGLKGLLKPGVTVSGPGQTPVTVETAPQDTVTALLARLAAAGAQIDAAQLAAIDGDVAFLAAGALALLPPAPLTMAVSVPAAAGPFADPVMPLDVSLTLSRPPSRIDPAFAAEGEASGVQTFTTRIGSPVSSSGGAGGQGIDQDSFGTQLAQLFPTLRLVTGRVAGAVGELWFLPFDASGITALTVEGVFDPPSGQGDKWPRYFALRPLYSSLVSLQGIQLPELNPDGTLNRDGARSDLIGIDVEPIAQRFLQDVEQLLSAQYAGALYADPQARTALLSVIASKRTLAPAVSNGIAPVFQQDDPDAGPAIQAAARELSQLLSLNLAQGYAVSTILQYVSACSSAWSDGSAAAPARLLGRAVGRGDDDVSAGLQYSITDAKTGLDAATGYVNFLLTLNDPAHAEEIALALDYAFSNIEYDIDPIPVGGGTSYDASDWLAFTPALDPAAMPQGTTTRLGDVQVPIPNRAFPQLPTLRGQTVGHDPAATLADAAKWTYALRYSHEHASQDEVHLDIRFNQQPDGLRAEAVASDALAAALVSYNAVATELWDMLGYYADPAKGDATSAASAAASFATLVAETAAAWDAHWPHLEQQRLAKAAPAAEDELPGLAAVDFGFDIDLDYTTQEGIVLVTDVRVTCGDAGPGPSGAWPDLVFRNVDGLPVQTTRTDISPAQSLYTLEHPAPAGSYADIALTWHGIAMASYQNATASLMVTRNQHLSADFATNPDFVFSTDLVNAASTVTPINTESQRFDITGLGTDLGSALTAAFQTLFGTTAYLGQPVTLALSYGFEILADPGGSVEPLVTYLPIALYPDQQLAASTGATLQGAVDGWIADHDPNPSGGEIVVSLSLYSQIQNSEKLALLVVERMVYKLDGAG